MNTPRTNFLPALLALAVFLISLTTARAQEQPGTTQVMKWKDGKKACFLLAFDDGAATQLTNVVPELDKRKIVGTFYIVTGNSLYKTLKRRWEEVSKSPYIVVANHTFTHKGANDAAELDQEVAKCNEVLLAMHPERKKPRLLAFAKPGGVPWKVTQEELDVVLKKYNLVDRPPFYGPPMHYKSAAEMVAAVDKAIAKGEMGHMDFHGVGGDWLVTPVEWFTALLDKLEASRDQVWITDAASWRKYITERDSAEVKATESSAARIKISLTAKTDPALYDEPLTLSTRVPATWKRCRVSQGAARSEAEVANGAVKYDAIPGAGEIILEPMMR